MDGVPATTGLAAVAARLTYERDGITDNACDDRATYDVGTFTATTPRVGGRVNARVTDRNIYHTYHT